MYRRFPLYLCAAALAVVLVPATSAHAGEDRKCGKFFFMDICAPSLSGSSRVVQDQGDHSEDGQIRRSSKRSVVAVRQVDDGEGEGAEKLSMEEKAAERAARSRARAEETAAKAREAAELAEIAEARARRYEEKLAIRTKRAEDVPSERNLAHAAETAEKAAKTRATADKAAAKADLKAEIAERAAEQASKEADEEQPEEEQKEQEDDRDYEEQL